jgi:1-piperideine-2-carboxylate/1-pyrroline-2-carboxylate reductase [NAD(P)H]
VNILSAEQTAALLPYRELISSVERISISNRTHVPQRSIYATTADNHFFVMPAYDDELCVTKLITHAPQNSLTNSPTIVGQVSVFDVETGQCRVILDGPTVTARRTAAVTGVFLGYITDRCLESCLIVGAGAQGFSHLEMLIEIFDLKEVSVASRTLEGANRLANHAKDKGIRATAFQKVPEQLELFDLVITCTPAAEIVIRSRPRSNAVMCAIGAYRPDMIEWDPEVIRWVAKTGNIFVDTRDANHEAGDILKAGLDPSVCLSLADLAKQSLAAKKRAHDKGPIFFKSCGWAGWDLAAGQCAIHHQAGSGH